MTRCLFVSDLHGRLDRYEKLLGGGRGRSGPAPSSSAATSCLPAGCPRRRRRLPARLAGCRGSRGAPRAPRRRYPRVLAIFGNDDPRAEEESLAELERARAPRARPRAQRSRSRAAPVYGYACVPPTPFPLKDWERYDVSRFVDPGCVSPEEGYRSVPVPEGETKWGTIAGDLEALVGRTTCRARVFLFHSPPYQTALDRAALDGQSRWTTRRSTCTSAASPSGASSRRASRSLTLHGHVHESARLTGSLAGPDRPDGVPVGGPRRPGAGARARRPRRPEAARGNAVVAVIPRAAGRPARDRLAGPPARVAETRTWDPSSGSSDRTRARAAWRPRRRASGRAASVTAPIFAAKLAAARDVVVGDVVDVEQPVACGSRCAGS